MHCSAMLMRLVIVLTYVHLAGLEERQIVSLTLPYLSITNLLLQIGLLFFVIKFFSLSFGFERVGKGCLWFFCLIKSCIKKEKEKSLLNTLMKKHHRKTDIAVYIYVGHCKPCQALANLIATFSVVGLIL